MHLSITKLTSEQSYDAYEPTSLQKFLEISFGELCDRFGEPTHPRGDQDKTDAEWVFKTPKGLVTIYNYKSGRAYAMGEHGVGGTPTSEITDWHVGAKDQDVAEEFLKLAELDKFERSL